MVPIRISVNEKLRIWQNESYEPYQKYKENLKYETDNGETVRSKSEVIIANILAKNNEHLLYKYERPLEVVIAGHTQTIHPDFTIINIPERLHIGSMRGAWMMHSMPMILSERWIHILRMAYFRAMMLL